MSHVCTRTPNCLCHPKGTIYCRFAKSVVSWPVGASDGCGTSIPRYLTEPEVRAIVRDELAKAAPQASAGDTAP